MKVENEKNDKLPNPERSVPTDINKMAINEVDPVNQSQASEPANSQIVIHKPNMSETNLVNMPPDLSVKPRFGRKRQLSHSNADSQLILSNASVIQSLESQPSQQVSSQWDEDCRTCKEYKVEVKRLQATIKRLTRDAEATKLRMDNNLAITLRGQETMQKELMLLRRNNEKLHVELTAIKALMREIQSAVARYKF